MARTPITIYTPSRVTTAAHPQVVGATGDFTTMSTGSGNGVSFVNNGRTYLFVGGHASLTAALTCITPYTLEGLPLADLTISVPAAKSYIIGPFPPTWYNQNDGTVNSDSMFIEVDNAITICAFTV